MRKRFEVQYEIGSTPIEEIEIPLKSRDELPPVIRALQHIYIKPELNEKVFDILEEKIKITKMGTPGMSLWEILVLGTVRLTLTANYDRLEHVANYDNLVRELLGIKSYGVTKKKIYSLTSLKENIRYIDDEILEKINELVVKEGHRLKKKEEEGLRVKVDSYVLESNVHFPTDINLLWDSARKAIETIEYLLKEIQIKGWRKSEYWTKKIKNTCRRIGQITSRGGQKKEERLKEEVRQYIKAARIVSFKIKESKEEIQTKGLRRLTQIADLEVLKYYEDMLTKHIDLVERRIIKGEKIPHEEKIFSIFEPYTEWINKGKSYNRVELGIKIAIGTDQFGFILHHRVMQKEEDVNAAVPMIKKMKESYEIESASFDKGYWSKQNNEILQKEINQIVLPKKGKRNKEEEAIETEKKFKRLRFQHSAIESDINSLEHHGLNRCPDKGLSNFHKYAALGVLALNLHRLGNILQEDKKQKQQKLNSRFRKKRFHKAA